MSLPWRHPLFLVGLATRLVLLIAVVPHAYAVQQWYAPFLTDSLNAFGFDPWQAHLEAGGVVRAFPYGYAMWAAFLPLGAMAWLSGLPVALAYGLTLLCVDVVLLMVLRRLGNATDRALLVLYWLSPIPFFATYWLGLNDVLPILLLMLGLAALSEGSPSRAAGWMASAVSAKLSMVLAVPFVVVYLFNNKRLRIGLRPFLGVLATALALIQVPYLMSASARKMLFGNPELSKVYDLALDFGNGLQVYVLPLVYVLALFGAWRIRRMSFELLLALLGIVFFLVLLLTPASQGWFVWVLPFLVLYQIKSDRVAIVLVGAFSLLYVGLSGLMAPLPYLAATGWPGGMLGAERLGLSTRALSIWQTLLLASGLIVATRMLREGIQTNEYFRLSRRPFLLGIAGDSGSGKDTLAGAVVGLFGMHSVAALSGDDYHLWDRQRPMWQVMTHLNPRANDLVRLAHDTQALSDGRAIQLRRYDHANGKICKSQQLRSNDFIIVSGLHALYLPLQRDLYDLKVYLDMDEPLRRHLKIQRDVNQRGHRPEDVLETLAKRDSDSQRFVRPQAKHADLLLSLRPIHSDMLERIGGGVPLRLKLQVHALQSLYYEDLVRVLIGVCGLQVDFAYGDGTIDLSIEGDTDEDDIALAARELLPQLRELLDTAPAWRGGMLGLMQLVVLIHIAQALRTRLL